MPRRSPVWNDLRARLRESGSSLDLHHFSNANFYSPLSLKVQMWWINKTKCDRATIFCPRPQRSLKPQVTRANYSCRRVIRECMDTVNSVDFQNKCETRKALREHGPPPSILWFPRNNVVLYLFCTHILLWNDKSICHIGVRILIVLSCVTERGNSVLWKTKYI